MAPRWIPFPADRYRCKPDELRHRWAAGRAGAAGCEPLDALGHPTLGRARPELAD